MCQYFHPRIWEILEAKFSKLIRCRRRGGCIEIIFLSSCNFALRWDTPGRPKPHQPANLGFISTAWWCELKNSRAGKRTKRFDLSFGEQRGDTVYNNRANSLIYYDWCALNDHLFQFYILPVTGWLDCPDLRDFIYWCWFDLLTEPPGEGRIYMRQLAPSDRGDW